MFSIVFCPTLVDKTLLAWEPIVIPLFDCIPFVTLKCMIPVKGLVMIFFCSEGCVMRFKCHKATNAPHPIIEIKSKKVFLSLAFNIFFYCREEALQKND